MARIIDPCKLAPPMSIADIQKLTAATLVPLPMPTRGQYSAPAPPPAPAAGCGCSR